MLLGHKRRSEHSRRFIVQDVGSLSPDLVRQVPKPRVSGGIVADHTLPVVPLKGLESGIETGKKDEYLRETKVRSPHVYGTRWSGLIVFELTKCSLAAPIRTY